MIRVGLFGARGRMAGECMACLPFHRQLELVARVDREGGEGLADCDVVVDFSTAAATDALLGALEGHRAALVTGVTGRTDAQRQALRARAAQAPLFEAANFSLGVAVLNRLVREAAAALGPGFECEVFEIHHRFKVDAPSGTALQLAQAAAEGAGLEWPGARSAVREGATGPRETGQVGLAALRGGRVVGEHTVYFFGESERLELTHRAADRKVFAHGALAAAAWVARQPPGLYGMEDLVRPA